MSLLVTRQGTSPFAALGIEGEIDLATAGAIQRAVLDALRDGCTRVSLDLAGVTFMDTSGVHAIAGAKRRVDLAGGALSIAALSIAVERSMLPGDRRRLFVVV